VAQKKQLESEPAPHGQVALMLCESLLHELVENGVITRAQARNVVDTVVELVHEAAESGRPLGSARKTAQTQSAAVIIEAFRKSFAAKGAP
jgi:polyhydroxyalkanoate synthesis regulator phasin